MKPPPGAHGIMAHYFVRSGERPTQGALTIEQWEAGLDAYGVRLIPASKWINRAAKGRLRDEVCVTFDDGLREAYDVALPALTRRGLTAAWNVYTQVFVGVPHPLERFRWLRNQFGTMNDFYDAVDAIIGPGFDRTKAAHYLAEYGYLSRRDREFRYWRDRWVPPEHYTRVMERVMSTHGLLCPLTLDHWLSISELRALQRHGHVIGFHTHTHPMAMARLTKEQQTLEYATSRGLLEACLRRPVTTGSSPYGSLTPAHEAWMWATGIRLCWGATMNGWFPFQAPRWSTGYWRI